MTEVKVGGSVYLLDEDMTDAEVAQWTKQREMMDRAMADLHAVFPSDEQLSDALNTGAARELIERNFQRNIDAAKVAAVRSQIPECGDLPDATLLAAAAGDSEAKAALMSAIERINNPPRGLLSFDTENDLD